MQRNFDLMRAILLKIEATDSSARALHCGDFKNLDSLEETFSPSDISQHLQLLLDNGYIEATGRTYLRASYTEFDVKRITSAGYDYLDAVRDVNIFHRAINKVREAGAEISFEAIKAAVAELVSNGIDNLIN